MGTTWLRSSRKMPEGFVWPDPSNYDLTFEAKDGWELATLQTKRLGEPIEIPALVKGQLAVNAMLDTHGFTISLRKSGGRLSMGGRVFASSKSAMRVADVMISDGGDWDEAWETDFTNMQRDLFSRLMDEAEDAGEVFEDLVYPC